MRIQMNDERQRELRRLMKATGENTKTGALFAAARHYRKDLENKEKCIDSLEDEQIEKLSTRELPLSRETEHTVGKKDE